MDRLEFSRNILAGLTEEDFDKVEKNAQALNVAGFLEVLFLSADQELVVLPHEIKSLWPSEMHTLWL